ncbi:MAG: oligoendopeptidase F [Bacilli bacterium]|nr:oligoendopeptidase F [Bacilli bacterium]
MEIKQKLRSEIEKKYKWDLSSIYSNEDEFNKDKEEFIKLIKETESFKGRITSSSDTLYEFLNLQNKMEILISNLYLYANCKRDEDLGNTENQKRFNEINNINSICDSKTSFIVPELLKTDYNTIKKYIEENDKLKEYEFDLECIYRYQKYTLSDSEEELLSNIGELQSRFENNFELTLYSVIEYGTILDEDGKEVTLTNGNYYKYIRSKDRNVRKSAYFTRNKQIKKYVSLFAIDYEGNLKSDAIIAKKRGYKSSLEMYLYPDGVTVDIYNNLLNVAEKNKEKLYKYYKVIKHILNIEDLQTYDLSAPITNDSNKKYMPEDCREIITNALSVLGEDYINVIKKAFDENWIDFYPNKGKKSGYYETFSFKGNPVILANYNDDFNSVSSVCHELGHAVHSYFSLKNNVSHQVMYKIFVAEIASLTNELLLSNYIINNSNDENEKLSAINNILDIFSGNFFDTLLVGSLFEKKVHEKVYNDEVLTEEDFNNIFEKACKNSYGNIVNTNEYSRYNWSKIPHFYSSFYYYKYSIGISCACYIAKRILDGDKEYLNKYLNFLKLGGSMMPLDELKTIDIDLSKEYVFNEAINYFDNLIDELKKVYDAK